MTWIPKEERECIDCGKKGVVERRRCSECAKEYNRQRQKKYGRYFKDGICSICKKHMKLWKKTQSNQSSHRDCLNKNPLNIGNDHNKG